MKRYELKVVLKCRFFLQKKGMKKPKKLSPKETKQRISWQNILATSTTLPLISFGLCCALINAGLDVPALLQKVGISSNGTGEMVGTVALAYAAHKAASPIRFFPTVALTPIVASWIGKKVHPQK